MTVNARMRLPLLAASLSLALAASACSIDSTKKSESGDPVTGGTLKIGGVGDIDRLDPALTAYVPVSALMRAVTRQLVSYKTIDDEKERIAPQGDLATEVPEPSDDGLTYTFTLRDGIQWDTDEPREIVAGDVARGFKRLCNPMQSSFSVSYFTSLITGMDDFCDGFADVAPEVEPMKEYIENNEIEGITTEGDKTVTFKLDQKAGDFMYMLTLSAATPAPIEVLDYLPDSAEYRDNFVASGPYRVKSYSPDQSLVLERNPAWKADADPLRKAYVDGVEITMGLTADAIAQQLRAGSLDMTFDVAPPPTVVQQLRSTNDPKLSTVASGQVNPFIWINTKTDNNDGALRDIKVRQALEYAVDKAAVVQTLGGSESVEVQHGIFGPGVLGFHEFNLYPTPDDKGDPEKAKALLAEAGYPDGLTLKMPYRTTGQEPQVAQTVQASLEKAGFDVKLTPVNPTDYYSKYLVNRSSTEEGIWDIAPVGWTPDWQGGAARSVFQPQFTYTGTPQTYNYVDYNNDEANDLAAQAIAATDADEAADLWGQVDETVMADAVVIPLAAPLAVLYHGERVQNFTPYALSVQGDWANVWLTQ